MRNGTSEVPVTYVVPGSGQDQGARPPKGGLDDPMVPAGPPPAPWRFGCRPPGVEPRGRGPRHPAPRPSPEGARGRGGRAAFFHRPRPRQRSLTNAHSSKKVTAAPALQLAVGAPTALAALTGLGAPLPAPQGARAPRAQNVRRSRVRSVTPPTGARPRGRRAEGGTGPSGTRAPTGECVWDPPAPPLGLVCLRPSHPRTPLRRTRDPRPQPPIPARSLAGGPAACVNPKP